MLEIQDLKKFLSDLEKCEKETERFGMELGILFRGIRRAVVGSIVEREIDLKLKDYEVK